MVVMPVGTRRWRTGCANDANRLLRRPCVTDSLRICGEVPRKCGRGHREQAGGKH
jgi:hypothetical protein